MTQEVLLAAVLLNAENESDLQWQYRFLDALTKCLTEGQEIDGDEFSLLVENIAGDYPISPRKAKRLVESTNVCCFRDGVWCFNEELTAFGTPRSIADIRAIFSNAAPKETSATSGDPVQTAILQGIRWCVEMVRMARESGMDGLPAFLSCDKDGDHLIGLNVAGTANADALSMMCAGLDYVKDCGYSSQELEQCYTFLLEKTLSSQCAKPGWDHGGFFPLEDQPEAVHPTVEATCLAIMALGDYFEKADLLQQMDIEISIERRTIAEAVIAGLKFLFRMQRQDGSFATYEFDPEFSNASVQSNENCTRMALSTMGVSKGSGIFDFLECFEYYGKCSAVIESAYRRLLSSRSQEEGMWAPYFGTKLADYPAADVLVSSARVGRAFIPVWWQMEQERGNILASQAQFLSLWHKLDGSYGRVGRYSFNTPTAAAFSASNYVWESYPDMLAAFTALQAYNLFGLPLTADDWALIEKAVRHTLELQHEHGHWNKPVAEKPTPFCAVSLAAIELLREYRKARKPI